MPLVWELTAWFDILCAAWHGSLHILWAISEMYVKCAAALLLEIQALCGSSNLICNMTMMQHHHAWREQVVNTGQSTWFVTRISKSRSWCHRFPPLQAAAGHWLTLPAAVRFYLAPMKSLTTLSQLCINYQTCQFLCWATPNTVAPSPRGQTMPMRCTTHRHLIMKRHIMVQTGFWGRMDQSQIGEGWSERFF